MECSPKYAEIVVNSKCEFDLILTNKGRPFDLSNFVSGNLVFLNTKGVRTVVPLTVPGPTPQSGILPVVISSVLAADADSKWANADLELVHSIPANNKLVPLNDKFTIIKRNAPPPVV